jgi:hypothetical protein
MNLLTTLADMRAYRSQLDDAIVALEALARIQGVVSTRVPSGRSRSQEPQERVPEVPRRSKAAGRRKKKAARKATHPAA